MGLFAKIVTGLGLGLITAINAGGPGARRSHLDRFGKRLLTYPSHLRLHTRLDPSVIPRRFPS